MAKKLFFLLLTLMVAGFLYAHPPYHSGPLDPRGGHNCWQNCEQWGLYQGEYHVHDEELRDG